MDRFRIANTGRYIAGGALALLAAHAVPELPQNNVFHRIIHSATAAGWAQALGAIGALGIAIWLNRRDAAERAMERAARARNAGLAVLPYLYESHVPVYWVLEQLKSGNAPDEIGTDDYGNPEGIGEQRFKSQGLETVFPYVSQLGPAARSTQLALLALDKLEWSVRSMYEPDGYYDYKADDMKKVCTNLEKTHNALTEAIAEVVALLHS